MSEPAVLTGGCLCGAIRYEAWGKPNLQAICHCRMCQRASGAPFMALMFMPQDRVKLIKGQTRVFHSSSTADQHFCGECGSPIFFVRHTRSSWALMAGSLDDPNVFDAEMHVCVESAVAWLDMRDSAPRYSAKPEGMTPLVSYDPVTGRIAPG